MQGDPDGLQELCRTVASATGIAASAAATAAEAAAPQPGAGAGTSDGRLVGQGAPPFGEGATHQVVPIVTKKLERAVQTGHLTEAERHELEEKLEEFAKHPNRVQQLAVDKFLSLGAGDLRWVVDKSSWLLRCLHFCGQNAVLTTPADSDVGGVQAPLIAALEAHALPSEALSQECWHAFAALPPDVQQCVADAVSKSILTNLVGDLSAHVLNICHNEKSVYDLEEGPVPCVDPHLEPLAWEAIDGTLYHRLLLQVLFKRRNSEERLLRDLAEADPSVQPGDPGSLLALHVATEEARREGTAEVLSLLHAAASSGLVRVCARFIAEGLDVNERAGLDEMTPLHMAASHGEVAVVKLLLSQAADPNIRDGDSHTALHGAVSAAVTLHERSGENEGAALTHRSLQFEACDVLLMAGADMDSCMVDGELQGPRSLADQYKLADLRNLMRLHQRLRDLARKFHFDKKTLAGVRKLQYETAIFVIGMFERHVVVSPDAAAMEFRALITADYIQSRDKVQRLGNRLAKRLNGLNKKAIDALVELPPEAGLFALSTWQIEEMSPRAYAFPNPQPEPSRPPRQDVLASGGGSGCTGTSRDADNMARGFDGDTCVVVGAGDGASANAVASSEVGFADGEASLSGTIASAATAGTASLANDVAIVGEDPNSSLAPGVGEHITNGPGADADGTRHEGDLGSKFLRHLQSKRVQEFAKEKRTEDELWLRCLGVRTRSGARRDNSIWKKEIDRRIGVLIDKGTTPLHKEDFDFRVRRFLHEFSFHSAVTRVSEALAHVESSTAGKSRSEVRTWSAYLYTLLRRFDPKLYEALVERDRRMRQEGRQKRVVERNAGSLADSAMSEALEPDPVAPPSGGEASGDGGRQDREDDSPRSGECDGSSQSSISVGPPGLTSAAWPPAFTSAVTVPVSVEPFGAGAVLASGVSTSGEAAPPKQRLFQ